jgi:hypothetical protein
MSLAGEKIDPFGRAAPRCFRRLADDSSVLETKLKARVPTTASGNPFRNCLRE